MDRDEYLTTLAAVLDAHTDAAAAKLSAILDALPAEATELCIDVFPDQDGEGTFDVWVRLEGPDYFTLNKQIDDEAANELRLQDELRREQEKNRQLLQRDGCPAICSAITRDPFPAALYPLMGGPAVRWALPPSPPVPVVRGMKRSSPWISISAIIKNALSGEISWWARSSWAIRRSTGSLGK